MVSSGGGASVQRSEILLVDDDQVLVDLLAFIVEQAGFVPLVATDPAGAIELFESEDPAVAVIDLNTLGPWDGFDLLADLRRRSAALPIIVLTARITEDDKVRALDLGADDYVVKPFGHRELMARIRAHARRASGDRADTAKAVLDIGSTRTVSRPVSRAPSFACCSTSCGMATRSCPRPLSPSTSGVSTMRPRGTSFA
jgi:DNA-binding response OmpR family regulator